MPPIAFAFTCHARSCWPALIIFVVFILRRIAAAFFRAIAADADAAFHWLAAAELPLRIARAGWHYPPAVFAAIADSCG
jgi:hypothetical protein